MIKLSGVDGSESWVHQGHITTICGVDPAGDRPVTRVCFIDGAHVDAFGDPGAIVQSLFAEGGVRVDNASLVIRKLGDRVDSLQELLDNLEALACALLIRCTPSGRISISDSELMDLFSARLEVSRDQKRRETIYRVKIRK